MWKHIVSIALVITLIVVVIYTNLSTEPTPKEEPTWRADFSEATSTAEQESKPLLILLTGTTWCPWCQKLERQFLQSEDVMQYLTAHFTLLKYDIPVSNDVAAGTVRDYRLIASKYGVVGFPAILVINPKTQALLYRTGYSETTVVSFIGQFTPYQGPI